MPDHSPPIRPNLRIHPMRGRQFTEVMALLTQATEGKSVDGTVIARLRQLYGSFQRCSQVLPAAWQLWPAIFVATQNDQVAAVIWLERDTGQRWQIEQLLLHPEHGSLEIGQHLVEYVIHHFGGAGVQQFLARVAVDNDAALSLLRQSNFRQLDRRFDFMWFNHDNTLTCPNPSKIPGLREALPRDALALQTLHTHCLSTTVRPYLERPQQAFRPSFVQRLGHVLAGHFRKRWLVETTHGVMGTLHVATDDYQHFHVDVLVSPGWQQGFEALVTYALAHCHQHTSQPTVTLHQLGKQQADTHTQLGNLGFTCYRELLLLIKDYWRPSKPANPLAINSPLLLVGGEPSAI